MRPVDFKMETCCLKHEIRCALWERYARAVVGRRGTIRRYLTLFSPAMMDIKHFHRQGLITFTRGQYDGVVGITNDQGAYADAIGSGAGRPQLLIQADVNDLLVRPAQYPRFARAFRQMFPFDIINLDYCDSVFLKTDEQELSQHISALNTIIRRQRGAQCRAFAILVTTLAERGQVAAPFLLDLSTRIDANLANNPEFAKRFGQLFPSNTPARLRKADQQGFLRLGVPKFIANLVSDVGFEVIDSDTAYLFRRSGHCVLHVAMLARMPPTDSLGSLGRQTYRERNLTNYLDRWINGKLIDLKEAKDLPRLEEKHKAYVTELAAATFEVAVPEPQQE